MEFVGEARNFYKLYSVQINAVLAFLAVLEGYFHVVSEFIPEGWLPYLTALFAIAGILGRLLPQPEVVQDGVAKKFAADVKKMRDD